MTHWQKKIKKKVSGNTTTSGNFLVNAEYNHEIYATWVSVTRFIWQTRFNKSPRRFQKQIARVQCDHNAARNNKIPEWPAQMIVFIWRTSARARNMPSRNPV